MPSLLIWTGPPGLGAGLEKVTTLNCGCGFQLFFFLPYIPLFRDGQDLMIMHTKVQGGDCPPCHPQSLLSIMTNRGEGKAGGKLGLAGQAATLADGNSREKAAGRGEARRWRWCECKQPRTGQEHAQAAMPQGLEKSPVSQQGLLGQTRRFGEEKQCREPKPSKKREVVQGTSASPDQTPALTAGLLRWHWGCSCGEQNLSGEGKAAGKGLCKRRRDS